jgi:hypothetical protein
MDRALWLAARGVLVVNLLLLVALLLLPMPDPDDVPGRAPRSVTLQ